VRTWGIPILAVALAVGVGIGLGIRSGTRTPDVSSSEPTPSGPATTTTAPAHPRLAAAVLFRDTCGSCHSLAAAGSTSGIGPDLDEARPSRDHVRAMIENGSLSGLMPPGLLSGDDAARVAAYVAGVAGRL